MEHTSAYRKKELTRNIFEDSLVRLLKEKSFNDITIMDITRESGLSRGTFYNYFGNTIELLESLTDRMISLFYTEGHFNLEDPIFDTPEQATEQLVSFMLKNREIINALLQDETRYIFLNRWFQLLLERGEKKPERYYPKEVPPEYGELFQVFWFNGMWAVYSKMLSDKQRPTDDYTAFINKMTQKLFS